MLFYNLALLYDRRGLPAEALAAFERSHDINPRPLATAGRVRAAERAAGLRVELASRRESP